MSSEFDLLTEAVTAARGALLTDPDRAEEILSSLYFVIDSMHELGHQAGEGRKTLDYRGKKVALFPPTDHFLSLHRQTRAALDRLDATVRKPQT